LIFLRLSWIACNPTFYISQPD